MGVAEREGARLCVLVVVEGKFIVTFLPVGCLKAYLGSDGGEVVAYRGGRGEHGRWTFSYGC